MNPTVVYFDVTNAPSYEHTHHFNVRFVNEVGTPKSPVFNVGKGTRDALTGTVTLELPGGLFESADYNVGDSVPGFLEVAAVSDGGPGFWERIPVTAIWEAGDHVITNLRFE